MKRTFQSHNVPSGTLHHLRNHIIYKSMLIPDLPLLETLLILLIINLLKDILKSPIILLENGILGTHIKRQTLCQRQLETRVSEALDRFIGIVLCLRHSAASLELKDFDFLGLAAVGREDHLQRAVSRDHAVFGSVLVAEGVTADDYGFLPAGDEAWDAGDDNGFSEDGSS